MAKTKIDRNVAIYPMPVVLAGATVRGRANFLAIGWIARVNYTPPLVAMALSRDHYTAIGIREHGEFSVNVPGVGLLRETDYCGLVSGREKDKSQLFTLFTGELRHAPLIRECPLGLACRLSQVVELPSNDLFVGEIVEAYADEACLTDGAPDVAKLQPFTLTMPDNTYWAMGDAAGKAWDAGRALMP
jgi:flavin reductase (DIM6/NTAB) family NADH-FMN oxidoreductase RutF